jgi:hypothetical protein
MHREKALESIAQCSREELEEWKKNVLRCKAFFLRDRNSFEIEECDFLLKHIERRLGELTSRGQEG